MSMDHGVQGCPCTCRPAHLVRPSPPLPSSLASSGHQVLAARGCVLASALPVSCYGDGSPWKLSREGSCPAQRQGVLLPPPGQLCNLRCPVQNKMQGLLFKNYGKF